jgi:hypothetical protein
MIARDFAELIDDARQRGENWTGRCPAHEDRRPSLSWRDGDSGLVLHCHRGCTVDEICGILKIHVSALFRESNGHRPARDADPIIATYDYVDLASQMVFQVVRTAAKRFWQRRPGSDGTWVNGLGDAPRVLYHLDRLRGHHQVAVAEGEKDVDRLWELGIPATCNPMGAGKWTEAHTQQLVSAGVTTVILFSDNDTTGQQHVETIGRSTTAAGLDPRHVQLPGLPPVQTKHGEDLSDWLDDGHTLEELHRAIAAAGPDEVGGGGTPPADAPAGPALLGIGLGRFLALHFPPVDPFIEGILTSDGPGWIAGEEKLGKTIYALSEAVCLALGLPVCGRFPVPNRRRVLFIEEEDSPRRTHTRLRALLRGHGLDPDDPTVQTDVDAWFTVAVWQGFTFDQAAMVARLEATIAELRPAVVYLDVLRKLTTKSVRDDVDMSPILAILDDLRRGYGCLFRVVHHYRKGQGFRTGRGSQELGGSYVLGAWGENSVFLEPIGRKQGAVKVEIQQKDGPPVPGFRLTIESEGPHHAPTLLRLTATDAPDDQSLDDTLLQAVATLDKTEALAGRPGVAVKTLVIALKKSDKTIRRGLKRLLGEKLILVTGQASKQQDLYGVIE